MKSFVLIVSLLLFSCASKNLIPCYDKELTSFEYPFEVKTFKLSSQNQNLKMRYMDVGSLKSDKVAVLLHGKNFSGFYWERIAKDLGHKGYRVIIPDQIGFGKSSKPKAYQYTFSNLALNTSKLLKSLNISKFTLVGHSMGGMLATHMASKYKGAEKLVLINPIGLEDYLKYVEFKDPDFFYKIELSKTISSFRNYQKKNYYDGKWSPTYERLIEPFKGLKNGDDFKDVAWSNALTYGPIFTEGIVSILENINVPTYLIVGTRDRTGPGRNWKRQGVSRKLGQYNKLGKDIKKKNPRIHLYELKGLGHMPQFEDYGSFSKIFKNVMR